MDGRGARKASRLAIASSHGPPRPWSLRKLIYHCKGEEIACNLVAACRLPLGRPIKNVLHPNKEKNENNKNQTFLQFAVIGNATCIDWASPLYFLLDFPKPRAYCAWGYRACCCNCRLRFLFQLRHNNLTQSSCLNGSRYAKNLPL